MLATDPANAAAAAGRERAEVMILASTTEASRQAELQRGQALFDAGRYEEALRPLADAAADPGNVEARELLEKARRMSEGLRKQKDLALRIQELLGQAERFMAARQYADAWVRLQSVLELDHDHVKAAERLRQAERLMADDIFGKLFPNQPPVLTFFQPRLADLGSSFETWSRRIDVVGVATDDRGVAKLRFLLGGQVVVEQEGPADPANGSCRATSLDRQIDLPAACLRARVAVEARGSRGAVFTSLGGWLHETRAFGRGHGSAPPAGARYGRVAPGARHPRASIPTSPGRPSWTTTCSSAGRSCWRGC